jgi:hypothetical protein
MRLPKAVGLCLLIMPATALFAEEDRPKSNGKVVAATVAGDVEAVGPGSTETVSLKARDVIGEKHTVKVGTASATTLVFSNGATISLQQKSKLVISEFLQDPFSTPYVMEMETAEPTVSTTKLNLVEGEMVCKVKKLSTDEGSSFTVDTPVGAAGIRGTIFAITFQPDTDGAGTGKYVLSVTEGVVSITDSNGNVSLITAGREIEISFRSKVDELTGEVTVMEILAQEIRDIPLERQNRINRVAKDGEVDAELIIFDPSEETLLDVLQAPDGVPAVINTPPSVTEPNPPSNFQTAE